MLPCWKGVLFSQKWGPFPPSIAFPCQFLLCVGHRPPSSFICILLSSVFLIFFCFFSSFFLHTLRFLFCPLRFDSSRDNSLICFVYWYLVHFGDIFQDDNKLLKKGKGWCCKECVLHRFCISNFSIVSIFINFVCSRLGVTRMVQIIGVANFILCEHFTVQRHLKSTHNNPYIAWLTGQWHTCGMHPCTFKPFKLAWSVAHNSKLKTLRDEWSP